MVCALGIFEPLRAILQLVFQEVEGAGSGVVDDEFGDLIFVAAVDVDFDFAIA